MNYLLDGLLKVRNFRVDTALRSVVQCRAELELCQQQVKTKREELLAYIKNRLAREQQLYADVMGQTVRLHELEELKNKIRLLRFEQLAFEQQLLDAERAVAMASEALQAALLQHRQALRAEEKLKQHHEIWKLDARRWMTLKEDAELEDIPFRPSAQA